MLYREAGIGIELHLQSTGQNRKFLNDIPPHLGSPIEPEDFHVTTLYPDEIARAGLGTAEKQKLPQVSSEILSRLGELQIIGAELAIIRNRLRPYKKFLGIEIAPEENLCSGIRSAATPVIAEGLGLRLPDYLPRGYHASVAYRDGGMRRPVPYRRRFPQHLTVTGYSVGVRNVAYTTDGQPADYVNGCFRNRSNSPVLLGRQAS